MVLLKKKKVEASTTQFQKEYNGIIQEGSKLEINDFNENEILSLKLPKNATYIYFNYPKNFSAKLNGNEISLNNVESTEEDIPIKFLYGNSIKLEIFLLLFIFIYI